VAFSLCAGGGGCGAADEEEGGKVFFFLLGGGGGLFVTNASRKGRGEETHFFAHIQKSTAPRVHRKAA